MLALALPAICQAQDPATAYAEITAMKNTGQTSAALKKCDQIIKFFSNKNSRVAGQFAHMLPFFYSLKAELYQSAGDLPAAFKAYEELINNKEFRGAAMINAAKRNPGKSLDYMPLLGIAEFQLGYIRYIQATGNAKTPGKPEFFADAIKRMESYLKYLKSSKVTALEKRQGLDGKVCFILMQAYILQPKPDFKKANYYIEKSRESRAKLGDELVMSSLATIVKVAGEHPEYASWIHKIISSSPESYNIDLLRGAKFGARFLNFGLKTSEMVKTSIKLGKFDDALEAVKSALSINSLVPDGLAVRSVYEAQLSMIGKSTMPGVPDRGLGVTYVPAQQKKYLLYYNKLAKDNMQIEGLSLLGTTNAVAAISSNRLAKAGYQLVLDRFPKLSARGKNGKFTRLYDGNKMQLAQYTRATGDIAMANTLEKELESTSIDGEGRNVLIVNKMARLISTQEWAAVIPAADDVMKAYSNDKKSDNYSVALFCKIAAYYKLQNFAEVIKLGDALLASDVIKKPKFAKRYEPQCMFFVLDALAKMESGNEANYTKSLALSQSYMEKFNSTDLKKNPLAANVYFAAVDVLLKRAAVSDAAGDKKDKELALKYCKVVADNWPTHAVYPTMQLLAANILLQGTNNSLKPAGIKMLEDCANAALTRSSDKAIASNALFLLVSFGSKVSIPKENEQSSAKRIQGYYDLYWSSADYAGDSYAPMVARLDLKRSLEAKDEAGFKAAAKRLNQIVARESQESVKSNRYNPNLEETFIDYIDLYYTGMESFGKALSYDQKIAFLDSIKGISPEDMSTLAIVELSKLDCQIAQLADIPKDKTSEIAQLNDKNDRDYREMTRKYDANSLTPYLCIRLGDWLVEYVKELPASREAERINAIAYYDKVIANYSYDWNSSALIGKANALSIASDAAIRKQAVGLYKEIVNSDDREIKPAALAGLTRLYMETKNYESAIASAQEFLKNRGNKQGRLDTLMLIAEAYSKLNRANDALISYMNLYNQNRNELSYSIPASSAIMEVLWKRDTASSGDRLKKTFAPSDRWLAWSRGQEFIAWIERYDVESKMSSTQRDSYRALKVKVGRYSSDASVQREDKGKRDFERKIGNN